MPNKAPRAPLNRVIFLRVDAAFGEQLDIASARLRARLPGARLTQSDIVRSLILRAIRESDAPSGASETFEPGG
jgi:hypothetical protein